MIEYYMAMKRNKLLHNMVGAHKLWMEEATHERELLNDYININIKKLLL